MKRESRTVDRSQQVDLSAQRHLPLVDLLVYTRAELIELAVASPVASVRGTLSNESLGEECRGQQVPSMARRNVLESPPVSDGGRQRYAWSGRRR